MTKSSPRRKSISRRKRIALMATGAAVGSAVGLILGAVLTFWLGEGTVRAIQRVVRRLSGDNGQPNFDLLMQ
jgi:membrane protein YqaA with SNARE-associated domain